MEGLAIGDLAARHSHGADIVLWWSKRSRQLWVHVTDLDGGPTDRIHAAAGNPLAVFHHAFAYQPEAA
jgi:hypothetical protein